jgi:DNA-binding NtrC family response regulator
MNDESVCRVLIVDNELDYAAQTAAKLKEIRPSLLNHNRLEIELTNSAYFAAEKLRQCPAGQPSWDVIIADVYMPMPVRSANQDTADCGAAFTEFVLDGKAWRCWEFHYESGKLDEKIDYGGISIAETITERLAAGEPMSDLKMILMSSCLDGEERQRILDYQTPRRSWLRYYDKADWRREKLTAWPSMQVEPDVFQWALFLAIAERHAKDWGGSILENIPDVQAIIGTTVTSELDMVIRNSWRLGRETEIETVLITGEVGTGRDIFAQLIHKVRMQSLRAEGVFVGIDCSSIPQEALEEELLDCVEESAGGTLFIDEVDKLTPPHQGRIYHLLKDKRIRGADRLQTVDFAARLAICTARGRNLEELNRSEMFHADLYYLLKDEQLHIVPLRERPADAVSIAEVLAHQAGMGLMLTDDARKWIETYHWPGNNKELRSVITAAARRELTSVLTADDLERVVKTDRRIPAAIEPDQTIAKNNVGLHEFEAEPPFQLLWDEPALIDARKRKISIAYDVHNVLKALLQRESGRRDLIKSKLTFAEIARLYKNRFDADEAQQIAHQFAHNLRRSLDKYGVEHGWLLKTWKGYGYRVGQHWDSPPYIYASEASIVFTDDLEQTERLVVEKKIGRKKKLSPER